LTGYLGIKSCVTKKYEQQDSAFVREDYQFIYQDISKSFSQIDQLRQLVGNDLSLLSIDELNSYEISLQNLHEKIEMNIRENCERLPGFCECDE
jgi:ABC-type dipeptide/oligopeptide/nickel transport system ATPase subunit